MKKAISLLLAAVLVFSLGTIAIAASVLDEVELKAGSTAVSVDGVNDATLTVSLTAKKAQEFFNFEGSFSTSETETSTHFTLTELSSPLVTFSGMNYVNPVTGKVLWCDDSLNNPAVAAVGAALITATYKIDKNTPAGTYHLTYTNTSLAGEDAEPVTTKQVYTVTITVTRAGASTGAEITGASNVTVGAKTTLTAKLLPANTTETITNVVWSSGSANAEVDASTGVVTGVSAGKATITATVTTSAGQTWTAAHDVTVTAAKTYTVKAAASAEKVYPDGTVTVTVTVCDNAFEGAEAVLTYDTTLFAYVSASNTLTGTTVTQQSGSVKLRFSSATPAADGSALATLTFKANAVDATATGTFGFSSAKAGETELTYSGNWPAAATESAKVSVVKQFTVKFLGNDSTQIGNDVLVDQGASVTDVPAAPEVDYHDFRAWTDGGADYTAEQIKAAAVTADVTYQAAYTPKTYTVTVPDTLIAAAEATYGTNYTGTIRDYDSTNYDYKVEFSTDGVSWTEATVQNDGFTVPGTSVTGDLTLRLTRTIKGVEMTTIGDYVDGWTLVLVKGTDGTAYSYDGNAMFKDAYTVGGKDYTFAWLIKGAAPADAGEKIAITTAAPVELTKTCDVNASGGVSYEDAQAAFGVMNKVGNPTVAVMLRADVDRSGKVDAADISAILADAGYTF